MKKYFGRMRGIALALSGIALFTATALFLGALNNPHTFEEENRTMRQEGPRLKSSASDELELSGDAALSIFVGAGGDEHTLLKKNTNQRLPIASITKLMTALVAVEELTMDDVITVSKSALTIKGGSGHYQAGDRLFLKDALHALLIASHNEIAVAISEAVDSKLFLARMNEKAVELGLDDTSFANVSGLDPDAGSVTINYSTASNVAMLLRFVFERESALFSILTKSEFQVSDVDGKPFAIITNTNKLLTEDDTALNVTGGKTGETPRAKMNLVIISDAPAEGYIVSVVLGSEDSFGDMRAVLEYLKERYVW